MHCLMAWQTAILRLQSWRTAPGLLWKADSDLIFECSLLLVRHFALWYKRNLIVGESDT